MVSSVREKVEYYQKKDEPGFSDLLEASQWVDSQLPQEPEPNSETKGVAQGQENQTVRLDGGRTNNCRGSISVIQ